VRPSPRRAHIWHYPLSAALKCEPGNYPDWTLVEVDLRHGIVLGNTLASLKFEALDRDSFSIVERPTIAPAPEVTEATGHTMQQPPPAAQVGDGPHTTDEPPPGSTGAGAPPRARNGRPIPSPAEQRAALAGTPDEGGMADAKAFDALQAKYAALDGAASAWLTSVVSESMAAGVSFHAKDNRTVRRFELIRALVIVASAGAYVDPDAVRSLLYHVHGEVALWPALTLGHLVGSLGADDAAKFAQRCWEVVG
jgi:hypothetical protein